MLAHKTTKFTMIFTATDSEDVGRLGDLNQAMATRYPKVNEDLKMYFKVGKDKYRAPSDTDLGNFFLSPQVDGNVVIVCFVQRKVGYGGVKEISFDSLHTAVRMVNMHFKEKSTCTYADNIPVSTPNVLVIPPVGAGFGEGEIIDHISRTIIESNATTFNTVILNVNK